MPSLPKTASRPAATPARRSNKVANTQAAGQGDKAGKQPSWTISELSREFDVTTRTIRFYEDEGLLNPERRGQNRIYSARDRVLLKLILRGKRLGFTLAECRELFDLYDPESGNQTQLERMLQKIDEKRLVLEQQRADIEVMQLELIAAEKRIRDAVHGITQAATTRRKKST